MSGAVTVSVLPLEHTVMGAIVLIVITMLKMKLPGGKLLKLL
jgi:hypothetical protein